MKDTYLAKHEVTLRELNKHLFGTKSIVKLHLEILDLNFGIREFDQS